MIELARFAEIGRSVVLEAGAYLRDRLRTEFGVSHKASAIDLVTDVDVAAEELIVSRLLRAFPTHTVLAEENFPKAPRSDHTWIIDPIDGTTNYAHRFPFFCVSIALEVEGQLQWGGVYNPNFEELFTASRGGGAFLNSIPIQVSRTTALEQSLLATGFPYDIRTSRENNLDHFSAFSMRCQAVRRAGSAALDLACVAAGRFDGFWELRLSPWDCAAGYLLIEEAGGKITNFSGEAGNIYERETLASNGLIHDEMLSVLRGEVPSP